MLVMADVARSFNVQGAVGAMLQSRIVSGMKKILVYLEEEIDRQMSDPWSKMTFLVVITREMIAVTLATDEERHQKEETLMKFCFTAADKTRKLGKLTMRSFCRFLVRYLYFDTMVTSQIIICRPP